MVSPASISIVKATAPVVAQHAEEITTHFYRLMFQGNPEVQQYFNSAHQHSGNQQRALAGAICAYAANIDNLSALEPAVELIAQKHCSLGIKPEHYPIVGKHLLAAITDILGSGATDEVLLAWREAYRFLAELFIQREAEIYQAQARADGGWNGYRTFVVDRKVTESAIVTSLYLKPLDRGPIPTFKPGQYITIRTNHSGHTTLRNYSLSDRPGLDYYRISVKRETSPDPTAPAGLVSSYLHDSIAVGDTLEVAPPCGEFTLETATDDRPLVLLSGGIGITPLVSMLKSLSHEGINRTVHFIHATRNSQVHALANEVREIAQSHSNVSVHFCYDEPLHDDVSAGRCDSVGRIQLSLLEKLLPDREASYFFCGPKPFMTGLYRDLRDWGVDEKQIHFEFFGPREELALAV